MSKTSNSKPSSEVNPGKVRRGRPRNPDILQQLAHDIGYEPADIGADQVAMAHLEAILRDWITSKDFRKQRALVELAYGRVPRNPAPKKSKTTLEFDWESTVPPLPDHD